MICGSRSLKTLTQDEGIILNKIMSLGLDILIGDAPGIDTAVQNFLYRCSYQKVTVYYARNLRNNIGKWDAISVPGSYTHRDKTMCNNANWLLAIWDGKSPGTKRNINDFSTDKVKVIQRK